MSDQDNNGVVISLANIYDKLQETVVTLAEIKGSLALQSLEGRNDKATLTDHESRIRKVEAKVYALPGLATLIGVGSLAYSVFGHK
jgi:hypothetical protein